MILEIVKPTEMYEKNALFSAWHFNRLAKYSPELQQIFKRRTKHLKNKQVTLKASYLAGKSATIDG